MRKVSCITKMKQMRCQAEFTKKRKNLKLPWTSIVVTNEKCVISPSFSVMQIMEA